MRSSLWFLTFHDLERIHLEYNEDCDVREEFFNTKLLFAIYTENLAVSPSSLRRNNLNSELNFNEQKELYALMNRKQERINNYRFYLIGSDLRENYRYELNFF